MAQAYDQSTGASSPVAGRFVAEADTPLGRQQGTVCYEVNGATLTGTIEVLDHTVEVENGTVNGNSFHHLVHVKGPMPFGKIKITVDGHVDGDTISGSIKSMIANANFTGARV